jgi:hypothetical protein
MSPHDVSQNENSWDHQEALERPVRT